MSCTRTPSRRRIRTIMRQICWASKSTSSRTRKHPAFAARLAKQALSNNVRRIGIASIITLETNRHRLEWTATSYCLPRPAVHMHARRQDAKEVHWMNFNCIHHNQRCDIHKASTNAGGEQQHGGDI
eukprot:scaffold361712_cov31-Prasinocladus_malaysianus.AAC.2